MSNTFTSRKKDADDQYEEGGEKEPAFAECLLQVKTMLRN